MNYIQLSNGALINLEKVTTIITGRDKSDFYIRYYFQGDSDYVTERFNGVREMRYRLDYLKSKLCVI